MMAFYARLEGENGWLRLLAQGWRFTQLDRRAYGWPPRQLRGSDDSMIIMPPHARKLALPAVALLFILEPL